jgi:hypothetical protein
MYTHRDLPRNKFCQFLPPQGPSLLSLYMCVCVCLCAYPKVNLLMKAAATTASVHINSKLTDSSICCVHNASISLYLACYHCSLFSFHFIPFLLLSSVIFHHLFIMRKKLIYFATMKAKERMELRDKIVGSAQEREERAKK